MRRVSLSRAAALVVRASPALRAPVGAQRFAPSSLALRARWLSSEPAVDATPAASSDEAVTPAEDAASSEVVAAAATTPPQTTAAKGVSQYRVKMMRAIKDKDYELVLNEYEDMVNAGVAPDTTILNCLVEAKAHSQGTVAARETFRVLLAEHSALQPSAQTYAALMQPCQHDGDTATAFELYNEALAQPDMPLHVDLFNMLISVATRAQDFTAAEKIFDEMREKGVKPKSATYLKYIYACFRLRQPDKAYEMLLNMEKEWRVPETRDYQRMHQLFKFSNHEEGKALCLRGLVQDLQAAGGADPSSVSPDLMYGLFRDAQERRQPQDVVQLAETMQKANMPLDRFMQVGVVFAHISLAQPVAAFSQVVELYDAGHALPERAAMSITEELAKQASAVDESYFYLESRKQEAKPVPLPAVNLIIEACALMGDLDRAFATWAELDTFELTPNAGTFNALLHTCVRTREVASGRRLLSRMNADGVEPDAETFMHQASLAIMSREDGVALKMLDACKEAGHKPPGRMYVSIINVCTRSRKYDKAAEVLEAMEADGYKITPGLRAKVQGPQ